ncbi:calcium:hydrogen antiporter [Moniliophthora roreri MCA 2997]|uniref:Calcium:hydrogen antiporter n=2 Tax=Moniliophthora roreri TaxID=221103 RepID=V2YI56_MONRO|nr:calcium:hydrogen antiporter [Moniliophthora roreri MCA 2997]
MGGLVILTSFYLVASIEEFAGWHHISKPFIASILPILVNPAKYATSVWMAMKSQMETAIGICIWQLNCAPSTPSSAQKSTIPAAQCHVRHIVASLYWIPGHEFTLPFANFQTIVFFVSVFSINKIIRDGESNYLGRLMLITCTLSSCSHSGFREEFDSASYTFTINRRHF